MLLSIIIPAYNVEQYLSKCLESLIRQEYINVEIIVINDGSTDRTQEIIDLYTEYDKRVKSIVITNSGAATARNLGIENANGAYLTFVDADDWVEPFIYKDMIAVAEKTSADMVACNYINVNNDSSSAPILKMPLENIDINEIGLSHFLNRYFIPYGLGCELWNKVYKKELIDKNAVRIEPNSEVYAEDMLFNLYLLFHMKKVGVVNLPHYNHVVRDGSITHSPKPKLTEQFIKLIEKYRKYAMAVDRFSDVKSVVPNLYYALIKQALSFTFESSKEKIYDGASQLKIATQYPGFNDALGAILASKDYGLSAKIFSYLCLHRYYRIAASYKYLTGVGYRFLTVGIGSK